MIRAVLSIAALVLVAVSAVPAAATVRIEEVTSPGGIRAWLVEDRSIPFLALDIRFRGGAPLDPEGKRGAVNLMTALLEEGAGEMDARAFAEARESLAAGFSFDAGDDYVSVSARMLTENRDAAADLLRLALTAPRFDPDAVERVRGQVYSVIDADASDQGTLAAQAFDRLAYGTDPYGTSLNGTRDSVASLTRDDLAAVKDRVLTRDRIFVAAVGDIGAAALGTLLDRLLGDLPVSSGPLPERGALGLTGGVTVIDYASPQSTVVFGQPGIGRDDPDFFPAFILNEIVGGNGFGSRLMTEVREKRGLTYGIGSYLVQRDRADLWQGSFSSSNDKVAEAIAVIRDVWAKIAAEGVTEQELEAAKTYLTGSYPLRFDGNGTIAGILVGMQMQGLSADYVNTRNAKVEAVTLADIRRVAARLADPSALRFVVAGQPADLAAE